MIDKNGKVFVFKSLFRRATFLVALLWRVYYNVGGAVG